MKPRVIVHNSISLDGSFVGFEPDIRMHYKIAAGFKAQVHLVGSGTAKKGIELYGGASDEEEGDFIRPKRDKSYPYFVIPDSRGILHGILHMMRRSEYCRDVIVLVSEKTPKKYLEYLKKRDYDYHIIGKVKVDLRKALEMLNKDYHVNTVMVDSGKILVDHLLDEDLVDELSLLIHPVVVGKLSDNLFALLDKRDNLSLIRSKVIENKEFHSKYILTHYRIDNL